MDCAAGQKASRHQGIQASRGGTASPLCGVPCFGRSDSRYPSQTARSLRREGWIDTGLFCCACVVAAAAVVTFMPPLAKRVMTARGGEAKQHINAGGQTKGQAVADPSDRGPSMKQTPHEPSGERFGFPPGTPALPEGDFSFDTNTPRACASAAPAEGLASAGRGQQSTARINAFPITGWKPVPPQTRTSLLFARVFRPGRFA